MTGAPEVARRDGVMRVPGPAPARLPAGAASRALASARAAATRLVGDDRHYTLEHRLFTSISLLNGLANVAGAGVLAVVEDRPLLVALNLGVGLLFLCFYAASRRGSGYAPLYWPFVLTIAVFLVSNSLASAGSEGGAYFYFVPALVIATILADAPRKAALSAALFTAAPLGIVVVERVWPEAIAHYSSPQAKLLDVSGNFIFASLFTAALVTLLSRSLNAERRRSDALLLNVLPAAVARELKYDGAVRPRSYREATVLFTDFVGFTRLAERMGAEELVAELDRSFSAFDAIARRWGVEKIKTIGDAFMAAGGIPEPSRSHAVDCVLAALEIERFVASMRREREAAGLPSWELRIGLHSGPLVAGVIGREKFAFDVWGDTVNTASRLETSGVVGRVNVSAATRELVEPFFVCEHRGKVAAKGKGELDMYLVDAIRPELSAGGLGLTPNGEFWRRYASLA